MSVSTSIVHKPWLLGGLRGGLPPSLDLKFLGVLDPRITFTRASTATYFDSGGTMQTAASGAPRFDYDPVTHALRGLLIEEARTNVMLQSADFTAGVWGAIPFGQPTPPVVTANQAIAPDGTVTADRIALPVVPGSPPVAVGCVMQQGYTATANPFTLSVWLKGAVGGEQLYLMTSPDGALFYRVLATLTTSWQRIVLATPALTATTWQYQLGIDRRDASQSANPPAQTIYAWGAQVEQGAFPTSYIPTTAAAVTRAYDMCFISPGNTSGWFVGPGGSWFAEFVDNVPAAAGTSPRVIGIHDASSITPMWVSNPIPAINMYDGSGINTANNVTSGAVSKGVSTWAPGTGKICLNGGSITSGAMGAGFATLATAGVGLLSGNPGVVNESMSGYIRRVRYWPRVLSNAELQQVTR